MNDVVKNFKKGHKIHIKESQKGTFTRWCGGNVTDECIQRGKNSSNPKIRKKATFAANARKWKHKEGGIIKGQFGLGDSFWNFLYRAGIGSKGDFKRMRQDLVDFGILQDNSENPNQQIGGPTILPSITSGTVIEGLSPRAGKLANRAWLENSNPITNQETLQAAKDWIEMMKDKMRTITAKAYPTKRGRPIGSKNNPKLVQEPIEQKPIKLETDYTQSGTSLERVVEGKRYGISRKGRVSSNDRNARAMESGDARTTNAGYTNVKKKQIKQVENNLDKYPEHERKTLERELLKLYRKNKPESEINKVKREFYKYLAGKYGYFKIGGIIKAQEGAQVKVDSNSKKLNLNSKLNFIGQMLPSILNIGSNSSQQSNNTFMTDTSNTMTDATLQYLLQQQQQAQALNDLDSVLKSQYDLNNPNATGGSVVKSYIKNQLQAPIIAKQKEFNTKYKNLLDTQVKQQKTNYISNILSSTLQTGADLLANYTSIKKDSSVS